VSNASLQQTFVARHIALTLQINNGFSNFWRFDFKDARSFSDPGSLREGKWSRPKPARYGYATATRIKLSRDNSIAMSKRGAVHLKRVF
jgi:hypothetical protein